MEAIGLIFLLMWQFVKFFGILFLALFIPLFMFLAACKFALAVVRFGWKEAIEQAKRTIDHMLGRQSG